MNSFGRILDSILPLFPRSGKLQFQRSPGVTILSSQAKQLIIEEKIKDSAFLTVSVNDFRYREEQPVDPRIVIDQPNISLYCLDHENERAIFVETPPDVSLLQAPFYFVTQYETAQRLIAVPYDALHQLASEYPVDHSRIILVYSTGRCGSTLVSRVFDQIPEVASFSEPDVFTQLLVLWSSGLATDEQTTRLLTDCLTIMCANTHQQGKLFWVFKYRSYVVSMSDLLHQAAPEAKVIFLYREATAWAISFARAFGISDQDLAQVIPTYRWQIPLVDAYVRSHTEPISYPEYLAYMWVSCMQAVANLQQYDPAPFMARYEDIKVASREIMVAMCDYCGVPLPDLAKLDHTLAEDSQAGTVAARAETKRQAARALSSAEVAFLQGVIQRFNPAITAEMIIPGTFKPAFNH